MAHKLNGDVRLDNVLDVLLDTYLSKNGREEKSERLRDNQKNVGDEKTKSDTTTKRTHIPNKVRRSVFERDGFACSYTSSDGTCCKKTSGLELDHIIPVAFGGDNSEENLRVLCREHNQFFARQMFGREFVEEKISEKIKM